MPKRVLRRPTLIALLVLGVLLLPPLGAWIMLTQPWVMPVASAPPAIDPGRLRAHVVYLSETAHPRSFEHPAKLRAAQRYIRDQLVAAGAEVEIQEYTVQDEKFANVIARFGPRDGKLLVIGAHYDTAGDTPGADDNASGVAGLIELAHLLGKNPPSRPVELVAYTLEEPPHFRTEHMGSAHHAESLAGRDVEMMISLEMLGYFRDEEGTQEFPVPGLDLIYPTRGNFIGIVGRFAEWSEARRLKAAMSGAGDLPVVSINAPPMLTGIDFSDHRSYWAVGIPAVMVTDTAFFRNHSYHQVDDVADTLDYARMAKAVQGVFAFTRR